MSKVRGSVSRRQFLKTSGVLMGITLLVACGSEPASVQPTAASVSASSAEKPTQATEPTATYTPDPDETPKPTPDSKPTKTPAPGEVRLEIDTAADPTVFKYAQDTLEVPAGATKIVLKLNNKTPAKDEVGHNWVLVQVGKEESVLASGLKAGDAKDWLNVKDPNIIAHTKLIEGEDSDSVTFKAPASGSYSYICTFPDHFAGGEHGTLVVK